MTTTLRAAGAMFLAAFGLQAAAADPAPATAPVGWTLALTWSPDYCDANLTSKAPQCTEERYFTVDGLEPRFQGKGPECVDDSLSSDETSRWFSVIPNRERINAVWRRQGACSGLSSADYFTHIERASRRVLVPAQYSGITEPLKTTRTAIRAAFMRDNPGLTETAISLACHGHSLSQVRICFDSQFAFHECALPETCTSDELRLKPIRASRVGREPVYR